MYRRRWWRAILLADSTVTVSGSPVVSPYAKENYVSHTIYDHTSILKTVEKKWNLPALTRRDANANSLFDMLDFDTNPAFLKPPKLPAAANPTAKAGCLTTGAGTIPPPSAVTKV
jgi:phospholipase C